MKAIVNKTKVNKYVRIATSDNNSAENLEFESYTNLQIKLNDKSKKEKECFLKFVKKNISEAKFLNSLLKESNKDYEYNYKFKILDFLGKRLSTIANINTSYSKTHPDIFANQNQTLFYSKNDSKSNISKILAMILYTYKPEISTCILLSIYLDRITVVSSFKFTWSNIYR